MLGRSRGSPQISGKPPMSAATLACDQDPSQTNEGPCGSPRIAMGSTSGRLGRVAISRGCSGVPADPLRSAGSQQHPRQRPRQTNNVRGKPTTSAAVSEANRQRPRQPHGSPTASAGSHQRPAAARHPTRTRLRRTPGREARHPAGTRHPARSPGATQANVRPVSCSYAVT
ncbi:hypothetical protein SDC9_76575 [bioreactor metagenome]|uniref:Uncharacterized protein n=1 Tax=bioreactor metagenome TaxID=1076179 RepID=A0A644YU80_9ZZZZ